MRQDRGRIDRLFRDDLLTRGFRETGFSVGKGHATFDHLAR